MSNNNTQENFCHLHVHSFYSLLDGASSPDSLVSRAKELGMTAIALTDHNHCGGWLEFKDACDKHEIKPILGCEMYMTRDSSIISSGADNRRELAMIKAIDAGVTIPEKIEHIDSKGKRSMKKTTKTYINEVIKPFAYDTKQYHLVVLAMNQTGANNLIKLQSKASDVGTFNGRFCCDFDMLEKYNEGLIVTSACLGGFIPNLLMQGKEPEAVEFLLKFKEIFGDRFYLEIQPLAVEDQKFVNLKITELAKRYNIKLVATNDVHYALKTDNDDHDSLVCIGTGKKKDDPTRMVYEHDYWVRNYDEMIEAFERHEDLDREDYINALANTNEVSDRVSNDIVLGSPVPLFPKVTVPEGLSNEEYLTLRSFQNLYKYLATHPECDRATYEKRLIEELGIINPKGFAPYFLAIFEIIDYCKAVDIPSGPGRGSAAGSLVLFVNGGTKVVDPIKYDLLFFRFLTKDRKDAPDIDLDFSYYGRPLLMKWIEETHGKSKVCSIGTYTEIGLKSGIKDFGRILGISFDDCNQMSKNIDYISDEEIGFKFKDITRVESDLKDAIEAGNDSLADALQKKQDMIDEMFENHPELFRLIKRFEGCKRGYGVHASGLLVCSEDITDYIPTRKDKEGRTVALLTGPQVERMNLIKLDLLGLKTLDVLDKCIKASNSKATVEDLYIEVEQHLDDPTIFQQVKDKHTEGLFQIESGLFKGLASDMQAENINDICAMLALGRPGPLQASMDKMYAARKNGKEEAVEQIRDTSHITGNTYNTIIYQEQCMLIAKHVAKFDDSQSDSLCRKPLAKKKADLMNIFRKCFIYGKLNTEDPTPDSENDNRPYYDPKCKYGTEILGGMNNGYTEQELSDFYIKLKGYASYLFNKSHSASYSVITVATMFLKERHPSKFYAALLSMQDKEEKVNLYSKLARKANIPVLVPNITTSKLDFIENKDTVLYGLKCIKGIGVGSIPALVDNQPYTSMQDLFDKHTSKSFNKKIGEALIKAGALDSFNANRHELLNEFHEIRKDKVEELNPELYNKRVCMDMEREVLGTSLTYVPWMETLDDGQKFSQELEIIDCIEKISKKNSKYGVTTFNFEGDDIEGMIFGKCYMSASELLNKNVNGRKIAAVEGKKDGNKIMVSSLSIRIIEDEPLSVDYL